MVFLFFDITRPERVRGKILDLDENFCQKCDTLCFAAHQLFAVREIVALRVKRQQRLKCIVN